MVNLFCLNFILVVFCQTTFGLYEDQIGKFDWRQQYVGKVVHAHLDPTGKKIIVSTEENVLALLHTSTGKIEWRHILGSGFKNSIESISVIDNSKVLVISGSPHTTRVFDISTGVLLWELIHTQEVKPLFSTWGTNKGNVIMVEILTTIPGQHKLSVTRYSALTGSEEDQQIHDIEAYDQDSQCHFTYPNLVCINIKLDSVQIINIKTGKSHQTSLSATGYSSSSNSKVEIEFTKSLVRLKTNERSTLFVVTSDGLKIVDIPLEENVLLMDVPTIKDSDNLRYIIYLTSKEDSYSVNVYDLESKTLLDNASGIIKFPDHVGSPIYLAALLVKRNNDDFSFRFAITTSDHSLIYGSKKEIYWTREESLTSIIQTEMVDLPVSSIEASIEEEFGSDQQLGGVIGNTIKRITSQFRQVSIIAKDLLAGQLSFVQRDNFGTSSLKNHLERDRFGLHKLILVVTKPGKLIALDSLSGVIVWRRLLRDVNTDNLRLYVQRSSIHFPLEAQCTILTKSSVTGQSLLYVFHPLSGEPARVGDQGYVHLGYLAQQAMLLPQTDDTEFLKPLLILDHHALPHIYPHTEAVLNQAVKMSSNLYIFTADIKSCTMKGYSLAESTANHLRANNVWQVQLCSDPSEQIVSIVSKNPDEKVHSQGRVLADRSVLYKYLNPNMIVVATAGNHSQHKGYINVYLIDVVVGSIVFSVSHRRVQPPYHVVYAENWVVYAYYNEKYRRTEIGSLELFEGPKQINSTAFSSFAAPQPLIDRQAFIYPAHITAMKDTVSEQGMTAKHVLLGLSNGWIQELPRVFLDPRRPVVSTTTPEMREEGIMPYVPELPIPTEAIINYNRTVSNIKNIYITPSSLESTGLVFAYGLDIFYTQVTPSRTFDILSDDFEYFFIAVVLFGLTLASIITKRLASKKSLRQAWK